MPGSHFRVQSQRGRVNTRKSPNVAPMWMQRPGIAYLDPHVHVYTQNYEAD